MNFDKRAAKITFWLITFYVIVMWLVADSFHSAVVLTGLLLILGVVAIAIYFGVSAILARYEKN